MKVEQIINRSVKSARPKDSLNHAAQLMWNHSCGALVVVDAHSKPIGFTDRDICMAAYTRGKPLAELTVEGAMAGRIECCHADDELTAAMEVMQARHVRRLRSSRATAPWLESSPSTTSPMKPGIRCAAASTRLCGSRSPTCSLLSRTGG